MTLTPYDSSHTPPVPPPDSHDENSKPSQDVSQKKIRRLSKAINESSQVTSSEPLQLLERIFPRSPHVKEHAELFKSSRQLQTTTAHEPLLPFNPKAANINDVYMTSFEKSTKVENVFFKPGRPAAERSEICYGLTRLIGLESVVVTRPIFRSISRISRTVGPLKEFAPSIQSDVYR